MKKILKSLTLKSFVFLFFGLVSIESYSQAESDTTTINSTSNDSIIIINADGNVGIGTNTPTTKLEVVGDTKLSGKLEVESITSFTDDTYLRRTEIDDDLVLHGNLQMTQFIDYEADEYRSVVMDGSGLLQPIDPCKGENTIAFWQYGINKIWVKCPNDAKVGIGTDNPSERLSVRGRGHFTDGISINTSSNSNLLNVSTGWNGENNIPAASFFNTNQSQGNQENKLLIVPRLGNSGYSSLSKDGDIGLIWSDTIGSIGTYNSGLVIAPHLQNSNNYYGIRITEKAFIGIGTNNATQRLEIGKGNFRISGNANEEDSARFIINNSNATDDFLRFTNSSGDQFAMKANGTFYSRAVEVQLGSFPDYVFGKDYDLMSLRDLEQFIKINKHLPNVPQEQEVLKNGLNLGEMNATLLLKIEELTLYIIQQQKEIDELTEKVDKVLNLKN